MDNDLLIKQSDLDALENNQSRGIELGSLAIFLIRKNNQFFVYHNRCPHVGVRLDWQPHQFLAADANLIQCSMHGALFTIESGLCVAGPCQQQSLTAIDFSPTPQGLKLNKAQCLSLID